MPCGTLKQNQTKIQIKIQACFWLLEVKAVKFVFRNRIFPLLSEYICDSKAVMKQACTTSILCLNEQCPYTPSKDQYPDISCFFYVR